jgi:hypothetical protein
LTTCGLTEGTNKSLKDPWDLGLHIVYMNSSGFHFFKIIAMGCNSP